MIILTNDKKKDKCDNCKVDTNMITFVETNPRENPTGAYFAFEKLRNCSIRGCFIKSF